MRVDRRRGGCAAEGQCGKTAATLKRPVIDSVAGIGRHVHRRQADTVFKRADADGVHAGRNDERTGQADTVVKLMDGFVAQTVKNTVVIPDNSPLHKSNKFINKMLNGKNRTYRFSFCLPIFPN
jgi:hypothetical protein